MMQSPELDFVCDDLLKNVAYDGDKSQWKVYEPITENILSLVADFRWRQCILARKNDIIYADCYSCFPEVSYYKVQQSGRVYQAYHYYTSYTC